MRSLVVIALIALALPLAAQDAPPLWETPFFRFHAPDELAATADFYRQELEATRREARESWSVPLNETVDVFLWPRASWDALVRDNPAMRDVLAFVRGGDQSLVINHAGSRRAGIPTLRRVLVHEYTHVYLGRLFARWPPEVAPRRLPRWLEEGLAMAVAGETHWWGAATLRWRGPARVVPLMHLAENFPDNPAGQRLAYRQSADAVRVLIAERDGDIAALIDEIVDPVRGPAFMANAWNPSVVAGFEQRWHQSLRLGWRWMLIFTTGGFAWAVAMVLAFFAWRRRRRLARRRVARWALEAEGLIPAGLSDEEQDEEIRRLLE